MNKNKLQLTYSCPQNWAEMSPLSAGRFCKTCNHKVHDLSSMTPAQYRNFRRKYDGQTVCVRYLHDSQGDVQLATPEPPWKNHRLVDWLSQRHIHLKTAAVAGTTALALTACTHQKHDSNQHDTQQESTANKVSFDQLNASTKPNKDLAHKHTRQPPVTPKKPGYIPQDQLNNLNLNMSLGKFTFQGPLKTPESYSFSGP